MYHHQGKFFSKSQSLIQLKTVKNSTKRSDIPAEMFLYKRNFCSDKDQSEFRIGREIKMHFKIRTNHCRSYQHKTEKENCDPLSEIQSLC